MSKPVIDFKRGDSFDLSGQLLEEEGGAPISIAGWSVRSQIRSSAGELIAELTTEITDPAAGKYSLTSPPAETATWPVGNARMDIQFTDAGGRVMSTQTVTVRVEEDVTRP